MAHGGLATLPIALPGNTGRHRLDGGDERHRYGLPEVPESMSPSGVGTTLHQSWVVGTYALFEALGQTDREMSRPMTAWSGGTSA